MTLNTLSTLGLPSPTADSLAQALGEVQRIKFNILTGAGAATPIALGGIVTADTIVVAFVVKDPGAATTASLVPLTPTIPSNGNVQFAEATNVAAGDRVLVVWFDKA